MVAVRSKERGKRRRSSLDTTRAFYFYIAPWLIGFVLFTLMPMFYSLYTAFCEWNGMTAPVFTGLANFQTMFLSDKKFWNSLCSTFYYALVTVPLNLIIALALAQLLNQRLPGSNFFRSVFYVPSVIAGSAVYVVWQYLLNPYSGYINTLLSYVGIIGPNWLTSREWAMPALILMNTSTCGGAMLIMLAGLQDIPEDYYEAAVIDGASRLQVFRKITLPLLTPVIFFNLIMGVISALQVFAQPQIMTGGGPINATYVFALHLYNSAFKYGKFGYASALAWVLFIIILVLSLLIFKSSGKWVYYSEEVDS